jgi:hypothetical protein
LTYKIRLSPSRFRQFGETTGNTFCLVTSPKLRNTFEIVQEGDYKEYRIIVYDGTKKFDELLSDNTIPRLSHVLVITPEHYFHSPQSKYLEYIKLCVMPCNSTPTSTKAIRHFLQCSEETDPLEQEKKADIFFEKCESSDFLRLIDGKNETSATFFHLEEGLKWHEQIGTLQWGEQQLIPSGEISVLPVEIFTKGINSSLNLNGQLALKGIPVLHSGTPSFCLEDQERIFKILSGMIHHAVIVTLKEGIVVDIHPSHHTVKQASEMLAAFYSVDSRYQTLIEIGFSINDHLTLFPGNLSMNEVFSEPFGTVHFGFGLIPHTQYHLDIVCPGTKVLNERGKIIFGGSKSKNDF